MIHAWDMLGRKFNRLTVLSFSHKQKDRKLAWNCQCDCGVLVTVVGKSLRTGNTKSCGCVHGVHVSDPILREELVQLLSYDPKTGRWTWLREGRGYNAGDEAGYYGEEGYVKLNISNRFYTGHRLAWFYMTGEWADQIDHEDTNKQNNKWSNLRKATPHQNMGNLGIARDNTSGFKGVNWHKTSYRAFCRGEHLGSFSTAEEAARAYDARAKQIWGEFARTNFPVP